MPSPSPVDPTEGIPPPFKGKVMACEDSRLMLEYLVKGLGHFGIAVTGVASGPELDGAIALEEPDLVILDIGLPGEDGYSIAARLRRDRPHIGIIMLTARGDLDDRVRGLDCGADFYFAKPVDLRELASAVGSLYRRLSVLVPKPAAGTWRLDPMKSCLETPSGISVALTDNELRFLLPLLASCGDVVDRSDLARALGHVPDIYAMRRMETLLSRLRSKVQRACPGEPLPVKARHGRGYAFLSEPKS